MKSKYLIFLFLFSLILAGCSSNIEEENSEFTQSGEFSIEVYDLDYELLGYKVLSVADYESLTDALITNFDVECYDSDWGLYITSINNSIEDLNYYIAILENDSYALTGISELVIDDGDKFTFRVECYQSFDSFDLLVDQSIYSYYKTTIAEVSNILDTSNYWYFIGYYKLMQYSSSFELLTSSANSDLYKYLTEDFFDDYKKLEDTSRPISLAKWYYTARCFDIDLDLIKDEYKDVIDEFSNLGEYVLPYVLPLAKYFDLEDEVTSYIGLNQTTTTWGIDTISWYILSNAIYLIDEDYIDLYTNIIDLENIYINNETTLLGVCSAMCSLNINPRDYAYDLIEYIFNNFYDYDTNLFLDYDNYSTPQIYAYLVSYKIMRDTSEASNIFN